MDSNNNDLKCIFFALYYGQEVAFVPSYSDGNNLIKSKVFSFKEIEYLELKPLSKITDEDAVKCAKMFKWLQISETPELWNHPSTKEKVVKMTNNWKYGICILSIENFNLQQIDYLRSKGYALPFMEYSIEDLVNIGWVKLTQ